MRKTEECPICKGTGILPIKYDIDLKITMETIRNLRNRMYRDLSSLGFVIEVPPNEYLPEDLWYFLLNKYKEKIK